MHDALPTLPKMPLHSALLKIALSEWSEWMPFQNNLSVNSLCNNALPLPRHPLTRIVGVWNNWQWITLRRCTHYTMWYYGPSGAVDAAATALLHPRVDLYDQLYLPSSPGTLRSGAPPQSWIWILAISRVLTKEIGIWGAMPRPVVALTLKWDPLFIVS